jgi:hypothetical protein
VNKDYLYNSPTIKLQFNAATVRTGVGVFVEGYESGGLPVYIWLLITWTSTTAAHFKWARRSSAGVETILQEGDITLGVGGWHDLELRCELWGLQSCCYIDGVEIFWLTGSLAYTFRTGIANRQVGLVAFFTNTGLHGTNDNVRFRKISVHDNQSVPPVKIENDTKHTNCLMAYRAAEKILAAENANRSFSIDVEPTTFLDGKIDIGQQVTIGDPHPVTIQGTYRIMKMMPSGTACTLTLAEVVP